MAHLLHIINQQQAPIDEEKLGILCLYQNIWDHFGIARQEFSALPEAMQLQMLRKFYFDPVPSLGKSGIASSHIYLSIDNAIKNYSSLTMTMVIENGAHRSELTVSTAQADDTKMSINLCLNFGHFGTQSCDFFIEKANLPENTVFYVNQGYQSRKDGKKVYYRDVFTIPQIIPLSHQPKDIDS